MKKIKPDDNGDKLWQPRETADFGGIGNFSRRRRMLMWAPAHASATAFTP